MKLRDIFLREDVDRLTAVLDAEFGGLIPPLGACDTAIRILRELRWANEEQAKRLASIGGPTTRRGRSKQDYQTPPEFLGAVKRLLKIVDFDWDLAASAENAVTEKFVDRETNTLSIDLPYSGGWNWLNPPFGHIRPWVKHCAEQWATRGVKTAVLVPASVGSKWCNQFVHDKALVLYLVGRLTFVGQEDPYPRDCMLVLYGADPGATAWEWEKEVLDPEVRPAKAPEVA